MGLNLSNNLDLLIGPQVIIKVVSDSQIKIYIYNFFYKVFLFK